MLRLVSIIGIAIAMVIGFVALSTQMRDDFYMRSKVTNAVSYLRAVAAQELNCGNADVAESDSELLSSKPAIFSSVSYEKTDINAVNVVGVFYDTKGESGKLRIKQGRKFTLNCNCTDNTLQCKRGFTDINKNYIPHLSATKQ
ncbi:hypothetical protein [Kaarinaea lacus]